jgi:hypothetical protein
MGRLPYGFEKKAGARNAPSPFCGCETRFASAQDPNAVPGRGARPHFVSELVTKSLSVWGGLPSPPGHADLEVRATTLGAFLHKFSGNAVPQCLQTDASMPFLLPHFAHFLKKSEGTLAAQINAMIPNITTR